MRDLGREPGDIEGVKRKQRYVWICGKALDYRAKLERRGSTRASYGIGKILPTFSQGGPPLEIAFSSDNFLDHGSARSTMAWNVNQPTHPTRISAWDD